MTIHLLRDYVIQTTDNISPPGVPTTNKKGYVAPHLLAIFLRRVCRYTSVGNTNWNIDTVGTYLIATADTTPSSTPTFAGGKKASINLGTNQEYFVSIPSSARTVSGADIGRLLVLRSSANPRFNSGIFLIMGYDTGTNSYLIDYRTLGTFPPAESDALEWYLYERDSVIPIPGTNNTASQGYRGDGNSTTPRIILQSPHALAWQIRICCETGTDLSTNQTVPHFSTAPGFGGNSAGDFSNYGQHLHVPLWYGANVATNSQYMGTPGGGIGYSGFQMQFRQTIIADDTGQSVTLIFRRPLDGATFNNNKGFMISFGIPDNEPSPLPVNSLGRLYSFGCGPETQFSNNDITWSTNQSANDQGTNYITAGIGATIAGALTTCCPSIWTYVTGSINPQNSPLFDSQASDSPFISSTELLPVDLVVGTRDNWRNAPPYTFPFEPRVIGTLPFMKCGRSNFNQFSLTTDSNKTYIHLKNGVYMLWEGPQAVP